MPADKLILISLHIKRDLRLFVQKMGRPKGLYRAFLDLGATKWNLPIRVYVQGSLNGYHKIEFLGVARLGLAQVEKIAQSICGDLSSLRISRIDWAVDLLGISAWELAGICRVSNVQNSAFYRNRSGTSFYPHLSETHAILIYDRLKYLRAKTSALADIFQADDCLTRFEIQFRGKGVPIPRFSEIRGYAEIDLLKRVSFYEFCQPAPGSKPLHVLAAKGLQTLVNEFGLQNVSKRFAPAEWTYITERFLQQTAKDTVPDIRLLMQRSAIDWLEDRIRFPRRAF